MSQCLIEKKEVPPLIEEEVLVYSNDDISIYKQTDEAYKYKPTNKDINEHFTVLESLLDLHNRMINIAKLHKQWQLAEIGEDEYDKLICKELDRYISLL